MLFKIACRALRFRSRSDSPGSECGRGCGAEREPDQKSGKKVFESCLARHETIFNLAVCGVRLKPVGGRKRLNQMRMGEPVVRQTHGRKPDFAGAGAKCYKIMITFEQERTWRLP